MILSSAKYLFASAQDMIFSMSPNSSFAPFKNSSRGLPLIHFHLKVEKAPGKTETKPNNVSVALSR
jgi:hypothetical protein